MGRLVLLRVCCIVRLLVLISSSSIESHQLRRQLEPDGSRFSIVISLLHDWFQGIFEAPDSATFTTESPSFTPISRIGPETTSAPTFIIPINQPTRAPETTSTPTFIIPINQPTRAPIITDTKPNPSIFNSPILTPILTPTPANPSPVDTLQVTSLQVDDFSAYNLVGGDNARPHDAPFFALILTWNSQFKQWESRGCGASLLSNLHILTAAHCVAGRAASNDAVYISAYQPYFGNQGVAFHFSKLQKYNVHPQFDDDSNSNDVAIGTLVDPIDLSLFQPIAMAPSSTRTRDGETVRIYGFGKLGQKDNTKVNTLQSLELPFITHESCQQYYTSHVLSDMVCAGYASGGMDSCYGDSGGPMVDTINGRTVQLAIVSWGDGCAQPGKPGVYTSVPYHYSWIQGIACSAKGVDTSILLCQQLTSKSSETNPQDRSQSSNTNAEITTTTSCKSLNSACYYGGQCCSGICTRTSGSSQRVCSLQE